MFNKRNMLFAVLVIVSSRAAIADPAFSSDAGNEAIQPNEEQLQVANTTGFVLNENVYEIIQETSKMEFHVDSPVGDVWASFQKFEGRFVLKNSGVQDNSLSILINAGSLDTDKGMIGAILKGEDFFDVENFPSMRFVGTSFEWFNDSQAVVKGNLTIKNISKQVAFYIELSDPDSDNVYSNRVIMKATTTIRRSEFGIVTMLPSVSDNVNVYMNIEALKKRTSVSML